MNKSKPVRYIEKDGYLYLENLGYCVDNNRERVPAKCSYCGGKVISNGLFYVCENNNENEPHYIKVRKFKKIVAVPVTYADVSTKTGS